MPYFDILHMLLYVFSRFGHLETLILSTESFF